MIRQDANTDEQYNEEIQSLDFPKSSRFRNWCFTHNNYPSDHEAIYKVINCKYLIAGREICPKTGTPHLQGTIMFKDAKTFSAVKKALPLGVHIEPCRSLDHSINYCQKEKDFFFTGSLHWARVSVPTFRRLNRMWTREKPYQTCTLSILRSWLDTRKELWNTGIELSGPAMKLLESVGSMDQPELERLELYLRFLDLHPSTSNPVDGLAKVMLNKNVALSTIFPQIRSISENFSDFWTDIHTK